MARSAGATPASGCSMDRRRTSCATTSWSRHSRDDRTDLALDLDARHAVGGGAYLSADREPADAPARLDAQGDRLKRHLDALDQTAPLAAIGGQVAGDLQDGQRPADLDADRAVAVRGDALKRRVAQRPGVEVEPPRADPEGLDRRPDVETIDVAEVHEPDPAGPVRRDRRVGRPRDDLAEVVEHHVVRAMRGDR